MVKSVLKFASLAVAIGLSTPALGYAQAVPKTTGSSSSGSSSGTTTGTASGSSSGGGGGSSSSSGGSGGGGGVSQPPSGSGGGSSSNRGGSSGSSLGSSSGSSSTVVSRGKGGERTAPSPGGVSTSSAGTVLPTRLGTGLSGPSGAATSSGNGGRPRGDRPITGQAVTRTDNGHDLIGFPFFGPWGNYYPWYTGGFGWGAGFLGYSPWDYAATCWAFGRYGTWYDPYSYCWDPYSSGTMYGSSSSHTSAPKIRETMGTLRVKANVPSAKVYIDDALVGTVDEFDGLTEHLELLGGPHKFELRAEGYKTFTKDIKVEVGRTQTVRGSLKKQ